MEADIGNTSGTVTTAKILRLPDRAARGASDGEDQASGRSEFVRAVYEAAGGSCAQPVEMMPLARRLGLAPRAVENLAMRFQSERLVRVVSMANGLLRLTPEGMRVAEDAAEDAAEDVTEDAVEGAGSGPDPAPPVVGRGALRELKGMLDPLKVALDRLDLGGALDEEQRSELTAEIRTIEAQLESPKPKRRIVVAALESVEDIVWSAAGAAGGAGSETESKKILRAIDAFLGGVGGSGQTGRAAREAAGSSGEAANKAQAGRGTQGARNGAGLNGAGLFRPGGDLGDEPGARRPEEESAATARAREASGVRVRKWVRDDGGGATEQARGPGRSVSEGANEAVVEVGKGVGSAVEGVGEGADQAVRGAGGAAGRAGDAADRAAAQEAEAATPRRAVVAVSGDILRSTLNEDGEILEEDVIGNIAELLIESKYVDEQGGAVAEVKDDAGNAYWLVLDERGSLVDAGVVGTVDMGDRQFGQADGAVQQTTILVGEKMKSVQDITDQGAGATEDLAPNWLQFL